MPPPKKKKKTRPGSVRGKNSLTAPSQPGPDGAPGLSYKPGQTEPPGAGANTGTFRPVRAPRSLRWRRKPPNPFISVINTGLLHLENSR